MILFPVGIPQFFDIPAASPGTGTAFPPGSRQPSQPLSFSLFSENLCLPQQIKLILRTFSWALYKIPIL